MEKEKLTEKTSSQEKKAAGMGVIPQDKWADLSRLAWEAREHALVLGNTRVGVAALADSGRVAAGCNIEHRFRSHDIHAEVGAIAAMVAAGDHNLRAILIVAEKPKFTACGACMDWIMNMGGPDCVVGFQRQQGGPIEAWTAAQLMPHYPEG